MLSGSTLSQNDVIGGYCGLFGNNPGSASGGAIFAVSNQQISGSTVSKNSAQGGNAAGTDSGNTPGGNALGGGIFGGASLTISGSTVSNNSATAGAGGNDFPTVTEGVGSGGGIGELGGLTMSQCTISGNSAVGGLAGYDAATGGTGSGGGLSAGGTVDIVASTISGNSAIGGAGVTEYAKIGPGGTAAGGGMVVSGGTLTDDTIANNTATGGAGGPASFDGTGSGTGAGGTGGNGSGGGIEAGILTIADCTISGNSAVGGHGGAGNSDYPAGADGVGSGGGVQSASNPILDNTIVSANTADGAANDLGGAVASISTGNLIGVGGGLTNGVNGNHVGVNNPQLSALGNNGGPTETMVPLAGSPAIDAGVNSKIQPGVTTDQRGLARIVNITVDIGAVEVQALGTVSGVVFNDLNGDGTQESGEVGLSGRTVYADLNDNGKLDSGEPSTTTSSSGAYSLAGLPSGALIIRQVLPSGWRESYPALGGGNHVTLGSTSITGENFGATTSVYISGTVFNDANKNGAQDSGETGLSGWTVYIDLNNSKALQSGDPETTTNSSGQYDFTGLAAGTYIVRVIPEAGWRQTYPTDNLGQHITLSSGAVNTTVTFGFFAASGSISGVVFDDANKNGQQDSGESGESGWTVYIDLNNSNALGSSDPETTTNSSGQYSFSGLAAGTYIVRVIPASGWTQTYPVNNYGQHITLSSGAADTGVSFGFVSAGVGSISGTVFNDVNKDGKEDNGELGLDAWILYIDANNNGKLDPGEVTTQANANGQYTFSGLAAGTYIVRVYNPSNFWVQTYPTNNYGQHVTLGTGTNAVNENFGFAEVYGTISGSVGSLGSATPPIWTVYLDTNNDGMLDDGEVSVTTSANGTFEFAQVLPGTYQVRVVGQTGWTETQPGAGQSISVSLSAGQDAQYTDFTMDNNVTGTIQGEVFNDANGNGALDSGETGLAGWRVYLDTNNDGILDDGEESVLTNAQGDYTFTDLPAGNYIVRVVAESGWTQTYPSNNYGQHVTVNATKTVYNVRFGEKTIT